MPAVIIRPILHIRADDPLFDVIEQDLRFKIETDLSLQKRVRFGKPNDGSSKSSHIDIIGRWDENTGALEWPLIIEDDGTKREWEFLIEVFGDKLVAVYDRRGNVARPFFDGTIKTGLLKKRAYRLTYGCWVVIVSRQNGKVSHLKPCLVDYENGETAGWYVESRTVCYVKDAEEFYKLLCPTTQYTCALENKDEGYSDNVGDDSEELKHAEPNDNNYLNDNTEDYPRSTEEIKETLKKYRSENPLRYRKK